MLHINDVVNTYVGPAKVIKVSDFGALVQPIASVKREIKAATKKTRGGRIILDVPSTVEITTRRKPFFISNDSPLESIDNQS